MAEMTYTEKLIVTHCWCGIAIAIPDTLYRHMQQDEKNLCYCPVGHTFIFGGTFKEKYEEEQRRRQQAERRTAATRDLLHAEERSHTATRGHVTRLKKRVSAGVCPCCNRQFQNVARHMATKHPEFAE